jgi:hypothetical protein
MAGHVLKDQTMHIRYKLNLDKIIRFEGREITGNTMWKEWDCSTLLDK